MHVPFSLKFLHISYFNLTTPDFAADEVFDGATLEAAEELTDAESLIFLSASSRLKGLTDGGPPYASSESILADEPEWD